MPFPVLSWWQKWRSSCRIRPECIRQVACVPWEKEAEVCGKNLDCSSLVSANGWLRMIFAFNCWSRVQLLIPQLVYTSLNTPIPLLAEVLPDSIWVSHSCYSILGFLFSSSLSSDSSEWMIQDDSRIPYACIVN